MSALKRQRYDRISQLPTRRLLRLLESEVLTPELRDRVQREVDRRQGLRR